MKSAGKARNNGLYRHIRTSKEIIRNLLNDLSKSFNRAVASLLARGFQKGTAFSFVWGVQRG